MIPNKVFDMDLTPHDLAVFVILLRFNPSFPSHQKIAQMLRMSVRQVRYSLLSLKQRNMISWNNQPGRSSLYNALPTGVWITPRPLHHMQHSAAPYAAPPLHHMPTNKTNTNKTKVITEKNINILGLVRIKKVTD